MANSHLTLDSRVGFVNRARVGIGLYFLPAGGHPGGHGTPKKMLSKLPGARPLREQCFSFGWPLNQGVDASAWLPPRWRNACHLDIATGRWNGHDCLWRGWFLFLGMYPVIRTKRPTPHDVRAVPPDQRDVMVTGIHPIP